MNDSLILVNHVPLRTDRGVVEIDDQTWRDLLQYAGHFSAVTMAGPQWPPHLAARYSSTTWQAINELPCADRVTVLPLPYAYHLGPFLRHYGKVRRQIGQLLEEHRYRLFTLGSLVGDWPAVAGLEAKRRRLPYAVQFDRVEHEVMRIAAQTAPLKTRLKAAIEIPLVRAYHRHVLAGSTVGMFQGEECYQAYRAIPPAAECFYNTHTQKTDFIPDTDLEGKISDCLALKPFRICYAGRAAEEKAPLDWLRALHYAIERGANLEAIWLGDGPQFGAMEGLAADIGLRDRVQLPGFVSDRHRVLQTLRDSYAMMFCHKVPESPRCLVESLVAGAPIVGYGSIYPEGLVRQFGGGRFVKIGDWRSLGELLLQLDRDRPALAQLMRSAAESGRQFDEDTVFEQRTELLKDHLR